MFDNLTMEEVVDRLKEVRDHQKALKEQEDALKKRILSDGRSEIKSENYTMKIQTRTKEVFNSDAFIEQFRNDNNFEDEIKAEILETKLVLNELALKEKVEKNIIPVDYLIPFNSVSETQVITVK